jgi:hypothetical protein
MINSIISLQILYLLTHTNAAKIHSIPDVFGPNGADYINHSPDLDMAQIGIDILRKGSGEKC